MSSTQASITSDRSDRRASRPIDSAITRIASVGSMKQSITRSTIGAPADGKATPGEVAGRRDPYYSVSPGRYAWPPVTYALETQNRKRFALRYGRGVLAD